MDTNTVIDGRASFQDAVRAALTEAAVQGWREVWWCDPDFADWPMGEPDVIDSLTAWASGPRSLHVLAGGFDTLARCHPRWVRWRRQFAHRVHCRALPELQRDDIPVLLYAPGGLTLRVLETRRFRGDVSRAASEGLAARERLDAISQRSVEAFAPTTLGL